LQKSSLAGDITSLLMPPYSLTNAFAQLPQDEKPETRVGVMKELRGASGVSPIAQVSVLVPWICHFV
jgi:hypothetical protein